jgi:hypothetical protein
LLAVLVTVLAEQRSGLCGVPLVGPYTVLATDPSGISNTALSASGVAFLGVDSYVALWGAQIPTASTGPNNIRAHVQRFSTAGSTLGWVQHKFGDSTQGHQEGCR